MSRLFFGERWDAPVVEEATQVPTPVGRPCGFCGELIEAEDQGFLTAVLRGSPERPSAEVMVSHRECDLRSVIGPVEHLEGRCTCYNRTSHPDPDRSWREEGRAVLDWITRHSGPREPG